MNQQAQGYGPYISRIQGRTFITFELPTPPTSPPFVFDYEPQNVGVPAANADPWPPLFQVPDAPSPLPPFDPALFDPRAEFPVMAQNTPSPALNNNFVELGNWSPGSTPLCTADSYPAAYRAPSTGADYYRSTPSDSPTPESTGANYSLLSSIPAQPAYMFPVPTPASVPQTLPLDGNSVEIVSS